MTDHPETQDASNDQDASSENDLPETADAAGGDEADDAAEQQARDFHTDGGAALRRAQQSIREAEEAEGAVAAHDDIPILDDERAGRFSEDQGGVGGT